MRSRWRRDRGEIADVAQGDRQLEVGVRVVGLQGDDLPQAQGCLHEVAVVEERLRALPDQHRAHPFGDDLPHQRIGEQVVDGRVAGALGDFSRLVPAPLSHVDLAEARERLRVPGLVRQHLLQHRPRDLELALGEANLRQRHPRRLQIRLELESPFELGRGRAAVVGRLQDPAEPQVSRGVAWAQLERPPEGGCRGVQGRCPRR